MTDHDTALPVYTGDPRRDLYIHTGDDPYAGLTVGDRVEVLSFGRWKPATVTEVRTWPPEWKSVRSYLRFPMGISIAFNEAKPGTQGSELFPRALGPHEADLVRWDGQPDIAELIDLALEEA